MHNSRLLTGRQDMLGDTDLLTVRLTLKENMCYRLIIGYRLKQANTRQRCYPYFSQACMYQYAHMEAHICTHAHMHARTHACTHIQTHKHTPRLYTHACASAWMEACTAHMHAHTHKQTRTHASACMEACTAHMHAHTCTRQSSKWTMFTISIQAIIDNNDNNPSPSLRQLQ